MGFIINKFFSFKQTIKLVIILVALLSNIKYYKIISKSGTYKTAYIISKNIKKFINRLQYLNTYSKEVMAQV